jgi:hypothetical protein
VDNVNENTRLALLAFGSTLFLQWRGVKSHYEHLAQCLMGFLSLIIHQSTPMPAQLTLWLYIIGAVSVFDDQEQALFRPGLMEVLHSLNLKSWNEVRLSLKSVLWVDVLHDPPAKQIVEATLCYMSLQVL